MIETLFALMAGLGAGAGFGMWWGTRKLEAERQARDVLIDKERASKDALLNNLGEMTAKAVEPIHKAVTETVKATAFHLTAPLGLQSFDNRQPEEELEPVDNDMWPQWYREARAAEGAEAPDA